MERYAIASDDERVGDEKTTKVNVRVIAATKRELKQEVHKGAIS